MSSYRRRQERAAQLLAAYPHAAEMLGLYRHVVAKQAPLYEWALTADGLASGFSPEAGPPSFGDISRGLPVADLASPFRTFAGELGEDLGEEDGEVRG